MIRPDAGGWIDRGSGVSFFNAKMSTFPMIVVPGNLDRGGTGSGRETRSGAGAKRSLKQAGDVVLAHTRLQGRPLQPEPDGCPVRSPDRSLGLLQHLQYASTLG